MPVRPRLWVRKKTLERGSFLCVGGISQVWLVYTEEDGVAEMWESGNEGTDGNEGGATDEKGKSENILIFLPKYLHKSFFFCNFVVKLCVRTCVRATERNVLCADYAHTQ